MTARPRFLRSAQDDLVAIRRYLLIEAPRVADTVVEDLLVAIERLGVLPQSGPAVRDAHLRTLGYRYIARGRYVIFYKIIGRHVRIYRVLHGRRGWDRLL